MNDLTLDLLKMIGSAQDDAFRARQAQNWQDSALIAKQRERIHARRANGYRTIYLPILELERIMELAERL